MCLFSQEIKTNTQWEKLSELNGVVVVDVYSDWCGPCSAMKLKLKNIKERFSQMLHLVTANSDNITCLEQFRNRSEPTWIFIHGKIVNVMYGANAPKLIRMIADELKKELGSKDTDYERAGLEINELLKIREESEEANKKEESEVIDKMEPEEETIESKSPAEDKKIRDAMLSDEEYNYRPF